MRDWRNLTIEEYRQLEKNGNLVPFDIKDPKTLEFLFQFNQKNRQELLESNKQSQT